MLVYTVHNKYRRSSSSHAKQELQWTNPNAMSLCSFFRLFVGIFFMF